MVLHSCYIYGLKADPNLLSKTNRTWRARCSLPFGSRLLVRVVQSTAGKGLKTKRMLCCNDADRDSKFVPTGNGADFFVASYYKNDSLNF